MELSRDERIMEKYSEITAEISAIGWSGVLELYHPDVNVNNPMAFEVFKLYKSIYEIMQNPEPIVNIEFTVAEKPNWFEAIAQKIRNFFNKF